MQSKMMSVALQAKSISVSGATSLAAISDDISLNPVYNSPEPRHAIDWSKQMHRYNGDEVLALISPFKIFMSKSMEEQRAEEMRLLMKDRSLSKVEKIRRYEIINVGFA